jgi:hypothetical protein
LKKAFIITLTILGIIILIYIVFCLVVSFKINDVVNKAFQEVPYSEVDSQLVSEEYYYRIYSRYSTPDDGDCTIKYSVSFPFTIFLGPKTVVYYWYTCEEFYTNGRYSGSWDIPVKLELTFVDGHLTVTDYYEAP